MLTMVNINRIIDRDIPGLFEVYSIVTKEALTEPMSLSAAMNEVDKFEAVGSGNGVDIRRAE